jgi:PAS domain S-box-containing protein
MWSLIGLGMLLVIGIAAILTLRQVNESDYWVDHTRQVISTNQQLLSDVQEAESGKRGYLITGDDGYRELHRVSSQDISATLAKLKQLTADNPGQLQRIEGLEALIAKRMAVLDEGVRQRRQSGFDAAQAVVVAGQGLAAMHEIRVISKEIETGENRLLQERSQQRQSRMRDGLIATLVATLLALIALFSAPLDVRRAVRQRDTQRREKEEQEATVHALFQSAAQAILMIDRNGRTQMANPATSKMMGYSETELIGQSIEALIPEKLRSEHVGRRDQYFGNPQVRPMGLGLDLRARRKDGTEFPVDISLSYIQTTQGTLGVAFVTDISKRKADEQSIRRQGEELRRLAGRLMAAQDDERRRIARDLHDDLSQKLAYLAMDIGRQATKPEARELLGDLRGLQRRAAEAAESVRLISHQLHPSILEDIGLEAALEQYCEEFEERSGIATHFTARDVPENIPREVASSMYHIFQESLRNVSKHSEAEEVFVTLESAGNILRLSVKDEGVGLSEQKVQAGAGIGMVGMKERAYLINGTLSIESRAGEGTEVTVAVPLKR